MGVGGFLTGLGAFLIFAATMGVFIFLISFLGATSGPTISVTLRLWGRKIQVVGAVMIILVGAALIYASINPGVYGRLLLS